MNYYDILEVSEKSSTEVIIGAYKALVKKYHPDISKDARAIERMKSINLAYEVLSDPIKRAEYDKTLHLNRGSTANYRYSRNNTCNDDVKRASQRRSERTEQERAKKQAEEKARNEAQEQYYKQQAEEKAAELKTKVERRKANIRRFVFGVIAVLLLAFFHNYLNPGSEKRIPLFGAASSNKEAESYVKKAKNCISNGDYHSAMKALDACITKYPSSKVTAECEKLCFQIEESLKNNEPKNGTTLARTFQYMGGCILKATASSGPTIVIISDKNNPTAYASTYIRKGQTVEVPVTGGTYRVDYIIGALWFNDSIGFGDFCQTGSFKDDFVFEVKDTVGWISSSVWEITI